MQYAYPQPPKRSYNMSDETIRPGTVTHIRPPSAEEQDLQLISQHGDDFKAYTIELAQRYGASRELSIAQTKIDEAVMWLMKYLAIRETL